MCNPTCNAFTQRLKSQSLGVDFSPTASREAVYAVGTFETHEGG